MQFKYTAEMTVWLKTHANGTEWSDLAADFNRHFGLSKTPRQIRNHCHDNGIHNGIYHARSTTMNKRRPIGSTRLDKDGYVVIKVADPCIWKRAQLVEWEKYHEPIDIRKEMLIFLDGNRQNYQIENLYKIPRKYIGTLNKYNLLQYITSETIEVIMTIVKLSVARWDAEKEKYGSARQAQNAHNNWRYHNIIKKDPQLLELRRKRQREYEKKHRERLKK